MVVVVAVGVQNGRGLAPSRSVLLFGAAASALFVLLIANFVVTGLPASAQAACDQSISTPRVPGVPRNLAASFATGNFDVSWGAPTDLGNPQLSGYRVHYDPSEDALTESSTSTGREVPEWKGIGVNHTIEVEAFNCAGSSSRATVTAMAAELPSAPRMFTVVVTGALAVAEWKAPSSTGSARGLTGYVFTHATGGSSTSTELASNVFEHIVTGLSRGKTYSFSVAAKSQYGTGAASTATARVSLPADAPRSFSGSYSGGDIVLSWRAPASASGVTGYRLSQTLSGTTTTTDLAATVTSHTVSNPTAGATYSFSLAALIGTTTGTSVSTSLTVPSLPGAPSNVVAAMSDGDLVVSWSAPSVVGAAITGYRVAWTVGGSSGSATTGATELTYTISDPSSGGSYSISVSAVTALGAGAAASTSFSVPSPPGPARNLDAELQSDGDFRVSWRAPSSVGTSPVTGYRLEWTVAGSTTTGSISTTGLFHDIASPMLGSKYSFNLFAINAVGTGSAATLVVTVPSPPSVVRNLAASSSGDDIVVGWDAPSYAGTRPLSGYEVKWEVDSVTTTKTVGSAITSYTISEADRGKTYSISVRARNALGYGPAATSSYTVPQPPSAPRSLAAEMSNGSIRLSWLAPMRSGTSSITGYQLKTTVDTTTSTAQLGISVRSYLVTNPTPGKTYRFSLVAKSSAGTGAASDLSYKVPQPPGAPTGLVASLDSNGDLVVSWTAPSAQVVATLKRYQISWSISSGGTGSGTATVTVASRKHKLASPVAGATYAFSVSAVSDSGVGASASISFTVPKVPGSPRSLSASIGSGGKLEVGWSAPSDLGTPPLTGYRLSWTVGGGGAQTTRQSRQHSSPMQSRRRQRARHTPSRWYLSTQQVLVRPRH